MTLKGLAIVSLLSSAGVMAREIRSPLPIPLTGYTHYPRFAEDYDKREEKGTGACCCPSSFNFAVFGAGYARSADKAFSCKQGTCKVPLSTLIFGKSSFRVGEAFPAGTVIGDLAANNPFVQVSTITPVYDYNERGAVFGASMGTSWCDQKYHAGLRARIPVRDTEMKEVPSSSDLVGETAKDLFVVRQEHNTDEDPAFTVTNAYAVRLDFLAQLKEMYNGNQMVLWARPAPLPVQPTIVSEEVGLPHTTSNQPIVALIGSTAGTFPDQLFARKHNYITANLAADGSGVGNGVRGQFQQISYLEQLGGDILSQSKLFVVPTIADATSGGSTQNQITHGASQILAAVTAAVNALENVSVTNFFDDNGINMWDGRNKGLGDLDVDLYANGRWGCERRFLGELQLGLRLPTANKLCDCKQVIKQPLGNNGHVEGRLGAQLGWDATDMFKFTVAGTFNHVFSTKERIPAPFVGATIKNIGPCIDADISWNYGTFDAFASVFANHCCGFDVGYQLYVKGTDKLCPCVSAATDFAGNANQLINSCVATRLTNVVSHKVRTEFFLGHSFCEVFGGFIYTFAGKNAMRDSDCYLGMRINF